MRNVGMHEHFLHAEVRVHEVAEVLVDRELFSITGFQGTSVKPMPASTIAKRPLTSTWQHW